MDDLTIIDYNTGEVETGSDWYQALVEECKAIITEAVFISRWALVEGYHQLGERIVTDDNYREYTKGNKTSVQDLARNLRISERTIYYAMQFYDKYPNLDTIPEGKNISWNKIITKYLPEAPPEKDKSTCIDPPWDECRNCPIYESHKDDNN